AHNPVPSGPSLLSLRGFVFCGPAPPHSRPLCSLERPSHSSGWERDLSQAARLGANPKTPAHTGDQRAAVRFSKQLGSTSVWEGSQDRLFFPTHNALTSRLF